MFKFRFIFGVAMLGAVTCLPVAHAQASDKWPAKPITWLVGYAAGGSVDVATRIVARKVEAQLGQPVVVENRPGATGSIALAAAARAPKDGYTIITVPGPVLSSKTVPSFGKELVAVARLADASLVLVGNANAPTKSLKELIADIQKRPGDYSYGSAGTGTVQHLAGELFNRAAQTRMVHVPYKGGSQALTDVLGGQVPIAFLGVSAVLQQIKSGKLRAYAVTTSNRSPVLPDVPTMQESGLSNFEARGWYVVGAPAGTSADRVATLNKAINEALKDKEIFAGLSELGMMPAAGNTVRDANQYVGSEQAKWSNVAHSAHITLN